MEGSESGKSRRAPRPSERVILGIDPGTLVMGYAIIRVEGSALGLIEAAAIRFSAKDDHTFRLRAILHEVAAIIERHHPDELAIEAQFFGKNVQSMLKLGRAQGVAIAAALQRDIPVVEYAPRRVKKSITGRGTATKEQVAAMLPRILEGAVLPTSSDATDALAVALCHYFSGEAPQGTRSTPKRSGGRSNSWSSFLKNNPGRVKGG